MTVQSSLGDAKATTPLDTYAQLWPTAEDQTKNAALSIVEASLSDQPTVEKRMKNVIAFPTATT